MAFNYIDYLILAILALFIILGLRKGIIIGLATIAALVLGIYASVHFSNYLDTTLTEHLHPSRKWLPILSFAITFILVVIVVMLTARITENLVSLVGIGFLNRLGGALLGLAKGLILVSILAFLLNSADPHGKMVPVKDRDNSWCFTQSSKVFPWMMKTFGSEIKFPTF